MYVTCLFYIGLYLQQKSPLNFGYIGSCSLWEHFFYSIDIDFGFWIIMSVLFKRKKKNKRKTTQSKIKKHSKARTHTDTSHTKYKIIIARKLNNHVALICVQRIAEIEANCVRIYHRNKKCFKSF